MLFDNPIFADWYTDSMSIFRTVEVTTGNIDKKERKPQAEKIPCRIYSVQKSGPRMRQTGAVTDSTDKVACDCNVDIQAGDELHIVRGGMLGIHGEPERYFAGRPHLYHDPVGGVLSGLEHKEIPLLMDEIIN